MTAIRSSEMAWCKAPASSYEHSSDRRSNPSFSKARTSLTGSGFAARMPFVVVRMMPPERPPQTNDCSAAPAGRLRSFGGTMNYLSLLGKHLKSDEMLDLLETHDMEVIYAFDRTHENLPDEYWARCPQLGIQLAFDADQVLKSVFIHLVAGDGFAPADLADSDVLRFASKRDVASYAQQKGIAIVEGRGELFGRETDWIRLEHEGHSIHYEYRSGKLALVTLTAQLD